MLRRENYLCSAPFINEKPLRCKGLFGWRGGAAGATIPYRRPPGSKAFL